jgi:hypothetical protein
VSFSIVDGEFYVLMIENIDSRLEALSFQIANGNCGDFADYKHRCGQVKALRDMRAWALEANRKANGLPPLKD